ncbi:MAG TPA: GNAT family N-acetyltransferase [Polyangiaceae bacterium]|nr:GNAT family N-acetyltransferase [Polyangiaceae bacterium]
MLELRTLAAGDEALLESFLAAHRDTSMFLRSNARQAGLVYRGQRLGATYVAGFARGQLVGVAAHAWNGLILLQAPLETAAVVQACVDASARPVAGLTGPLEQVQAAREALGLTGAPANLEEDEILFVLDAQRLVLPEPRACGAVSCRPPLPSERDTLCAWRVAYEIECLGRQDSEELRARAREWIDAQIEEAVIWVAVLEGRPVSLSAFNAALPDIVQLGGVYTPPELRGRGYAKAVVAHSVHTGRARGATRAVLFTSNPSAMRTYEAVGFRRAGDYGLVLFA